MKKAVNFNFFSVLSIVIMFVITAAVMSCVLLEAERALEQLEAEMDSTSESGEIGDVEGWALIAMGIGYVAGMAAVVIGWIFGVGLPILFAVFIFVPLLIARLLYRPEGKKLLAYRILMGVAYGAIILWTIGVIILCVSIWSATAVEGLTGGNIVVVVIGAAITVYNTAVLFFGMRNTYTKRICGQRI